MGVVNFILNNSDILSITRNIRFQKGFGTILVILSVDLIQFKKLD